MKIQPKIEISPKRMLVGTMLKMSLGNNKTFELWKSFIPKQKEIKNKTNNELLSLQIYNEPLKLGDMTQVFKKWALAEVSDFNDVPKTLETFILDSGLYAVFHYKGLSTDHSIFIYIYTVWLPNSKYEIDQRPHFEILGDKYKNNDPNSEEEIWIPIKLKNI